MSRKQAVYALYRGDLFVDVGTAEEIASRQGVSPSTIRFYGYPSYRKRIKGDAYELIRIE